MRTAAILAFSKKGCELAERIEAYLQEQEEVSCARYAPEKYVTEGCSPILGGISAFTGPLMKDRDILVFVGACGIAVRSIAPYLISKTCDPAVLCVDETGKYVISLLSGHIGGGNRLTLSVAGGIGAVPVVTTATDVNGRFSVDAWAAEQGFGIGSMAIAKDFSAAILERDLPVCADVPIKGTLPKGLYMGEKGELGVCISARTRRPFDSTLFLIPKVLTLGIGCRRGTSCETIEAVVRQTLEENQLNLRAVREIASVTLKSDEEGLLAFAKKYRLPIHFYTPDELNAVEGDFTASAFVKNTVGVDNVCERSAAAAGGRLIVKKAAGQGVTAAVAERQWQVCFSVNA